MPTTQTLHDFILPLPPIATGDAERDALLDRLESEGDEDAIAALAARADAGPALVARLVQLAEAVLDVDSADQAEVSVHHAVHAEKTDRLGRIEAVAVEVAARRTPDGEAAMLRIFEEHPWSEARHIVGLSLVTVASPPTLARMAQAMDEVRPKHVWVRDVGTAAAVRLDPSTAFDRLAARFEPELAQPNSYFVRGLFAGVGASPPVDPRWFPYIARVYAHREAVTVDVFFKAQPVPAAVDAVAAFIAARAAAGEPWIAYTGMTLAVWGPAGRSAGPAVVAAASAALDAGWTDYRLVGPLTALVAIDDPAMLPALRALAPKAKRKAKTALAEAITKLARNEPAEAESAGPAPKPKPKPKKALDPERAPLATLLHGAGFSEARVAELVALAWPRITLEVSASAPTGVGKSRLGGEPDLPPGAEWPSVRLTKQAANDQLFVELSTVPHTLDGKHVILPLGFVAQLRLEDLAPLDPEGRLPETGLLSFFARQGLQQGSHGDLFRIASRVLFHEATDALAPVAPPPEVIDQDRHEARAVVLHRELPLAPPQLARTVGLLDDESARYDALYDAHVTSSGFGVLGRARAAYVRGLPGKGESLLLQCVSDGGTTFTWGDASSIFFLIADAALKRRDFTKVVCVADEL